MCTVFDVQEFGDATEERLTQISCQCATAVLNCEFVHLPKKKVTHPQQLRKKNEPSTVAYTVTDCQFSVQGTHETNALTCKSSGVQE